MGQSGNVSGEFLEDEEDEAIVGEFFGVLFELGAADVVGAAEDLGFVGLEVLDEFFNCSFAIEGGLQGGVIEIGLFVEGLTRGDFLDVLVDTGDLDFVDQLGVGLGAQAGSHLAIINN